MADDIERLTAQFDADISKFEKSMTRMGVAFDRQAKAIESSNNSLSKKLAGSWSTLDKLYGALKIGVAYEAAKGLGALVTKSLEAAAASAQRRGTPVSAWSCFRSCAMRPRRQAAPSS
jgi:phage-related tail protein